MGGVTQISEKTRDDIIKMLKEGKQRAYIARALAISPSSVRRIWIREGFPEFARDKAGRIKLSEQQTEEIVRVMEAESNEALAHLARRIKIDAMVLRAWLSERDYDFETADRSPYVDNFLLNNWHWKSPREKNIERKKVSKYRIIKNGYKSNIHTPVRPDGVWRW